MLEKRLGITQLVLLLAMFVFMGLTRGSRAAPFIHSSLARISRTPRSTTAPRPYLTSATPRVEDFSPTDSKVVSRGDSKPHLHSAPPNGSMNVSATESPSVTTRSSLQRLASPGRERTKGGFERAVRLPVANGRAHRLTNLVGQTRGLRSARPKHARQTSASLDFSEMSPAALRSYHGFPSPRAPSSSASGSEPPTAPFPSEGSRAARSVSRERVSGMAAVASSEEGTPRRSKATSSSHADRRQSNSETSEWTERSEDESAYERERDPIVVSAPSPRVHLPTPEPDLQPHIQPQLQKDDEGAPWQQVVSSRRSNSSSRPRNRPTSTGSLHSPARAGTPDTVRGPSNTPPPPHRSLSKSKPFTFGSSQSSHTTICP